MSLLYVKSYNIVCSAHDSSVNLTQFFQRCPRTSMRVWVSWCRKLARVPLKKQKISYGYVHLPVLLDGLKRAIMEYLANLKVVYAQDLTVSVLLLLTDLILSMPEL